MQGVGEPLVPFHTEGNGVGTGEMTQGKESVEEIGPERSRSAGGLGHSGEAVRAGRPGWVGAAWVWGGAAGGPRCGQGQTKSVRTWDPTEGERPEAAALRRNSLQGSGSRGRGRANAQSSKPAGGPLCQGSRDVGKIQKRSRALGACLPSLCPRALPTSRAAGSGNQDFRPGWFPLPSRSSVGPSRSVPAPPAHARARSQSRALRPLARPVSGCTVRDQPVLPDPARPGPAPWPRRSSLEQRPRRDPGLRTPHHPRPALTRYANFIAAATRVLLAASAPRLPARSKHFRGRRAVPHQRTTAPQRGPEELRRRRLGPSPPAPPRRRGFLPALTAHRSPGLDLHGLGPGLDEPFRHQGG